MSENISKAVGLTSYMVTLPPISYLLLAMLIAGFIFGLIINLAQAGPLPSAIINGLMLLTLPALLSSIVIKLMVWKLPYKRIVATAFVGEIIYSVAYAASLLLSNINPFWAQYALLVGSGLVVAFWWVTARYVFILKYRSILFAAVQLLIHLIFLFTNQALYVTTEPFLDVAVRFYVSSFALLASAVAFFYIVDAPAKNNFGYNSTEGISSFFGHWFYGNKDLEKIFIRIGEPVRTVMAIMGFKRKNDVVFFLTPCVHFGPFGDVGGSRFSHLLADEIDKKHGSKTFVFHGTAIHDLNPVSSSEMTKILDSVDAAVMGAKYKDALVSISTGQMEECKAQALRINDSAMIGISRAPEVTEDISLGLGLVMRYHAEKNIEKAMIVDQHNSETGEITWFGAGSPVGFRYLDAIDDALSKKNRKTPLKVGVSFRRVDSPTVGGAGIKVAVFSSSPEYVIVLIDSNGVKPQFRDLIESEVKKLGRHMGREFTAGIFTTDTHEVNMTRGIINPVKDEENVISAIREACKEAASDMQKATFFTDRRWFEINVLGKARVMEILTTANAVVAVAKATLPFIFIAGLLLLLSIATKL